MVLIWNRRRRTSLGERVSTKTCVRGIPKKTHNGYVHVCATAPDIAPAASFRTALGFCSPSNVRYCLTYSYVMKFNPTCTR